MKNLSSILLKSHGLGLKLKLYMLCYRSFFSLLDFDIQTYTGKDSEALQRPEPLHELPIDPDHVTKQYLLGSVDIPEKSYKDNE